MARFDPMSGRWVEDDETDMDIAPEEIDAYAEFGYVPAASPYEVDVGDAVLDEPPTLEPEPQTRSLPPRAAQALEAYRALPDVATQGREGSLARPRTDLGDNEETAAIREKFPELESAGRVPLPDGGIPAGPSITDIPAGEEPTFDPYAPPTAPTVPEKNTNLPIKLPEQRHTASTERIMDADPDGGKPNLMGIEDELGDDDPIKRMNRAGQLWAEKHPDGAAASRQDIPYPTYEPQGYRQSDADLQRMWAINTLFGKDGDNFRAVQMGQSLRDGYDRQNNTARERAIQDWKAQRELLLANRPADRATSELMAQSTSPEAASELREGSPAIKLMGQLGSLGMRNKSLELKNTQTQQGEAGKNYRQDKDLNMDAQALAVRDETTRRGQDANLKLMQAKQQMGPDPVSVRTAALLENVKGIDAATARRLAETEDVSGLTPSLQRKVIQTIINADQYANDPKKVAQVAAANNLGNARVEDGLERSRRDPEKLFKYREELAKEVVPFRNAYKALSEVKDSGALEVFARVGSEGWSNQIAKGLVSEKDQAAMGSVYNFMSAYAKGLYGASFTESEQAQLANASGVVFGSGVVPMNSPKVAFRFFAELKKIYQGRAERLKERGEE